MCQAISPASADGQAQKVSSQTNLSSYKNVTFSLEGFYGAVGRWREEKSIIRPPIQILMHAAISGVIISQNISGKC